MRAMKDSGVEWIDRIPADWEVQNLKNFFSFGKGLPITKENLRESGVPVISYGQIHGKYNPGTRLINELFRYVDAEYLTSNPSALVHQGDFIFADTSEDVDGCGNCCYVDKEMQLFAGYHTVVLSAANRQDNSYLAYLFRTDAWRSQIRRELVEVKVYSISRKVLRKTTILLPPAAEQQRIAAYLDDQCGEIDKVLAKIRESIEEYKKLKQSVITEAVTKGIRPDRPMKPSGIEWIGDIPAEWEVRPFRTVLSERNEKNSPEKTDERLSLSIDLGVTKYAEKTTNLDRFKEDVTQYKLAYPGDLVMNSMNMIVGAVGVSPYFGCVSPAYYTYFDKSASKSAARFCDFLFRTRILRRVLRSLGKGIYSIERGDDRINTCRLKVSREDLRALKIPVPMATEQQEIVAYLDQQCAEIDRLIAKKEQIISELEGYKKSLIYECVTGKREVAG